MVSNKPNNKFEIIEDDSIGFATKDLIKLDPSQLLQRLTAHKQKEIKPVKPGLKRELVRRWQSHLLTQTLKNEIENALENNAVFFKLATSLMMIYYDMKDWMDEVCYENAIELLISLLLVIKCYDNGVFDSVSRDLKTTTYTESVLKVNLIYEEDDNYQFAVNAPKLFKALVNKIRDHVDANIDNKKNCYD